MAENIKITVVNKGAEQVFEAPDDLGLNLMEFLKATEHQEIEGMCGGMALCATCHVRVLEGTTGDEGAKDDEVAMLETLPEIFGNSRLSCQIKLTDRIKNLKIELV